MVMFEEMYGISMDSESSLLSAEDSSLGKSLSDKKGNGERENNDPSRSI